ncbi:MAG: hypothetical protein ACRD2J_02535 [Thermoanaerobaculia bacterium]
MKRAVFVVILLAFPGVASAEPFQFGILGGGAQSMEDGFEFDFGEGVTEVFAGARVDVATMFNVKLGQADAPVGPTGIAADDAKVEYIAGQVEYQFDEIWGSSSVFAGPGVYRSRAADLEETSFGLSGGVNASFPLTRRFALLLELSYHWANFEEDYTFVTATGGLKVSF